VREAKIVTPGVGQGFARVGDLADNVEIVSLGFVVDKATAGESSDDVVIDTGRLLARDASSPDRRATLPSIEGEG
jgi:hypothetical protein